MNKRKINNQQPTINNQQGYIALIALLVIVAAGLTIGISVSLFGIDEVQLSYGRVQSIKAKNLANACIEDGLERLRNDWLAYSGSLSISANSCIINTVINGNQAILTATGTADVYNQKIQIQVSDSLDVTNWQED